MTVAGDLHWERLSAGIYETMYWANGYKYKITNVNAIYGPPNAWQVLYRWNKSLDKQTWKSLYKAGGYSSSYDTLKEAKVAAHRHNLRPRRKWKFVCKVTDAKTLTYYQRENVGMYLYQEENKDGTLISYQKRFLDPKALIKNLPECMFDQCDFRGYSDEELNQHYIKDHNVPDLSQLESSSG